MFFLIEKKLPTYNNKINKKYLFKIMFKSLN